MIELIVNGKRLETSEGEDLSLVLNKSINDFDDISSRSSSYSFDFELPPTPNNSKLLFPVSDVNALGDIGRVEAILLIDSVEYDRGTVFAFESQLEGNYTVTYQSGLITWAEEISNVKLNTLPWRGVENSGTVTATERFTSTRINTLNQADSDTQDLIYPLINRNNDGTTELNRPQIYVKSFIKNLFAKIGWSVDGSFLDKDEIKGGVTIQDEFNNDFDFKGLTFDPPFNFEVDSDVIEASRVEANQETALPLFSEVSLLGNFGEPNLNNPNDPNLDDIEIRNNYNGFFDNKIIDSQDLYNLSNNNYLVTSNNIYRLTLRPDIRQYHHPSQSWELLTNNSLKVLVSISVFKNGTQIFTQELNDLSNPNGFAKVDVDIEAVVDDVISFDINLIFYRFLNGNPYSNVTLERRRVFLTENTKINIQRKATVELGEDYRINDHLPDLSCLSLLQDIKITHNLMFVTNEKRKTVTIETWEDFYKDIGQAKNFTDKLDLSESPTINHLSDYAKELEFRYKPDDSDGYLKRWQQINERVYGRYRQSLIPANKFEDGTTVFETKLISPSIQGKLNGSQLITSMSREEFNLDDEPEGLRTGYNTRLYYVVRGKQYFADGTERSPFNITTALMESFGNVPILNNNQLTFNGENGLIARFWTKTLGVIQLGKRVNCKMLLSKYEFFNFDFSNPVFLEYPTKLKGYYLVESINDFEVTRENLYSAKVSLIKFKDAIGVEIDDSQKTNVNENTTDTQEEQNEKTSVYTISNEGESNETINRVYTIAPNGTIQNVII